MLNILVTKKGCKENFKGEWYAIILMVVMVSWVSKLILYTLNMCRFLHISYTSTKWLKNDEVAIQRTFFKNIVTQLNNLMPPWAKYCSWVKQYTCCKPGRKGWERVSLGDQGHSKSCAYTLEFRKPCIYPGQDAVQKRREKNHNFHLWLISRLSISSLWRIRSL